MKKIIIMFVFLTLFASGAEKDWLKTTGGIYQVNIALDEVYTIGTIEGENYLIIEHKRSSLKKFKGEKIKIVNENSKEVGGVAVPQSTYIVIPIDNNLLSLLDNSKFIKVYVGKEVFTVRGLRF